MKQSISCDSSLEESVQRNQALGKQDRVPEEKDKAEIYRNYGGVSSLGEPHQPGVQVPGSTGHQTASQGLPRLEQL